MQKEDNHTDVSMTLIYQSKDLAKIYMMHNVLENHGINSSIRNEFRAYNIGEIGLEVKKEQAETATRILEANFPEDFLPGIICPDCGASKITISSKKKNRLLHKGTILAQQLKYILTGKFPKGYYRCLECGQIFHYPSEK